jgi:hypothetical protein
MFRISAVCLVLLAATFLESSHGFHLPQHTTSRFAESSLSASLGLANSHEEPISANNDVLDAAAATTTRRDILNRLGTTSVVAGLSLLVAGIEPAVAFDGSGASASAGYSPATKAEKKKKFKERIVADVKDFNKLGQAIDKGDTQGSAWLNFFIIFQRREPDEVGRTYAALVDLRGLPTKKSNEFEGGDGLLLANTFTKPGKPPDNTPAVKSFLKLSKTFDAIEAAGKTGDAAKAKNAWLKTGELLSQYLTDVELPGDLKDPIYKP